MSADEETKKLVDTYKRMENFSADTERFSEDDYALIGRFIQAYCVADFEARRVIAVMREISGAPSIDTGQLSDKDTISHLSLAASSWKGDENIAMGVAKAAEILKMHHNIRHTFSHFAGRRIRHEDVFVFLSTSKRHNKLESGVEVNSDTDGDAYFRALPIKNVKEEVVKLEGHGQYLGNIGSFLRENAQQIIDGLSGDHAAE